MRRSEDPSSAVDQRMTLPRHPAVALRAALPEPTRLLGGNQRRRLGLDGDPERGEYAVQLVVFPNGKRRPAMGPQDIAADAHPNPERHIQTHPLLQLIGQTM